MITIVLPIKSLNSQELFTSQMREANKVNAQFVIIIGQEDISKDEVIIKNMKDGSQINASIDTIENYFGVDYEYK